jgi:hypothetical protein
VEVPVGYGNVVVLRRYGLLLLEAGVECVIQFLSKKLSLLGLLLVRRAPFIEQMQPLTSLNLGWRYTGFGLSVDLMGEFFLPMHCGAS